MAGYEQIAGTGAAAPLPVLHVTAECATAAGGGVTYRVCTTPECAFVLPHDAPPGAAAGGDDESAAAVAASAGFVPYSAVADAAGAYAISPDGLASALALWPARSCSPGDFLAAEVNSVCAGCPAGRFCPPPGNTTPVTCPVAHYCPPLATRPTPCNREGAWCPAGASSPLPCPAGRFCPGITDAAAAAEAPGDGFTAGGANECPGGSYCAPGATAPTACSLGWVCPPGSANGTALACPPGYVCPPGTANGTARPCATGFFCPPFSSTIYEYPCPAGMVSRGAAAECAVADAATPAPPPAPPPGGLSAALLSVSVSALGSVALFLLGVLIRVLWYELHTHARDKALFPVATAVRDTLKLGRFSMETQGAALQALVARLCTAVPALAVAAAVSPRAAALAIVSALQQCGLVTRAENRCCAALTCAWCIGSLANGSVNMEQFDARFANVVAAIRAHRAVAECGRGGGDDDAHCVADYADAVTVSKATPRSAVARSLDDDVLLPPPPVSASRRGAVTIFVGAGRPLRVARSPAAAPAPGFAAGRGNAGDVSDTNPMRVAVADAPPGAPRTRAGQGQAPRPVVRAVRSARVAAAMDARRAAAADVELSATDADSHRTAHVDRQ